MAEQLQYIYEIKLNREKVPSFEQYPFSLDAVKNISSIKLHPNVTFFIGENGSGKSTLMEAIAVSWGFNPEGGSKNFNFGTYESHSSLHEYIRLSRGYKRPKDGFFLRAESFFNVASEIQRLDEQGGFGPPIIDSYGGHSLHEQSHGESFMALLINRFGGNGLYILDEPEAALSPTRQMAMISRMHDLVKMKSQFIIATHSPIILAYPHAMIYQLDENGIKKVNYEETEHYQVTKDFLNRTDKMLDVLLQG
ncbi:MAG: AAA family ATPase [Deltaproteobacteria bacterium]|nr:MAG: AAA family ATPase [Deltaproteobacteria bacterium]